MSIIPCDNKNQTNKANNKVKNNVMENFDLPDEIKKVINKRTDMLINQSISNNIFQKTVDDAIGELKKIKDKLQLVIQESNNTDNSVLMFNTNGQLSKMA